MMQPAGGQEVELLLNILTFSASTVLGIVVYLKNRKSATNQLFMLLAFFIDIYIVVNYFSLHPPLSTPEHQLLWIRIVMATTSFLGPILLLLVHTFPRDHITLSVRWKSALLSLMTLSVIASLTPLVFSDIQYPGGKPVPVPGPGIVIFLLDFVGLFIASVVLLVIFHRRAKGDDRKRYFYFLIGVSISFLLMAISTVIFVVVLKTSAAVFLGPVFPVVFMASIAYAIVRHGLFNTKIVATKAFILIIWIILFSRVFLSESLRDFLLNAFVFLGVGFFGVLLMRSVTREVRQREEMTRLADSLERANALLRELDRQKTEFLSIASHQLRTPLSIIKGYIELLHDGAFGRPTAKMQSVFADIDTANERLVALVDEFLNISRIEQGRSKYVFAPLDIDHVLQSVVAGFAERAAELKMRVSYHARKPLPAVCADEEKIRNVLSNYIDNALKYGGGKGIVVAVRRDGAGVAVTVSDSGIGFSARDKVNFFERFYRGENVRTVNVNGTGLGLYVCKQFIEAHGGRVWAESRGTGQGSAFGFWIPSKQGVAT